MNIQEKMYEELNLFFIRLFLNADGIRVESITNKDSIYLDGIKEYKKQNFTSFDDLDKNKIIKYLKELTNNDYIILKEENKDCITFEFTKKGKDYIREFYLYA